MGAIVHLLRGVHVLVPRNMTKAAGFYNTLLECDEPALIVENLNGYRLKEKLPNNFGEFKTPIGVVETIREGKDITVVSYGSTLKIVEEVVNDLLQVDIDIEIIDAQSLLPFDKNHDVLKSIQKTSRLIVIDEAYADFAEELEEALSISTPEIFNTDQGSQFTAKAFTSSLDDRGIAISMDGRGRALDNVFIERLWRTVKYEDIYLKDYETARRLKTGLGNYFRFYCDERPHSSLGYRTPAELYLGKE